MKLINLSLVVIAWALCGPVVANDNNKTDVEQIENVIETFRLSIINKDKQTFQSLFYSENIPWIAVFSDEMVAAKRKVKSDFPRSINFGKFGSTTDMISDTEKQEEKMWNIKIDTDGYLGSVHFNYSDHRDGIKKAFGTEAWDLVKDESSWKIVSVKYGVTELATEKMIRDPRSLN